MKTENWIWITRSFGNGLKADYRDMLSHVPDIDGIVLTFIETGAYIEDQFSEKYKTSEEKLAVLVDAVADVVVNEHKKQLIIRTFFYNYDELNNVRKCLDLIKNQEIIVMCKETPHDFFVTHPVSAWIKNLNRPVLIEFDCAHEFSGQGIVASIFPGIHMERWKTYSEMENVTGFSIRTSRYGNTLLIDKPCEVNLYSLHQLLKNSSLSEEQVIKDFIIEKYGKQSLPYLLPAFQKADDIILSSFYTLGLNTTKHSALNFDYRSVYTRHVSGRWTKSKEVEIAHGVNKKFHYWKDIVNHLAPVEHKKRSNVNEKEIKDVLDNKWLEPQELMNEEYLKYIIIEKDFAVKEAEEALELVRKGKGYVANVKAYNDLHDVFYRTYLSAKIYRAAAKVYYGQRIAEKGQEYITNTLKATLQEGLDEYSLVSELFNNYTRHCPEGQFKWKKTPKVVSQYLKNVDNFLK